MSPTRQTALPFAVTLTGILICLVIVLIGVSRPDPASALETVGLSRIPSQVSETAWIIKTADAPKAFSSMSDRSIALDANGYPHIAYGEDHLYYTWFDGSTGHSQTVDSSGRAGRFASLALDQHGYPHISYGDSSTHNLKYAHWTGTKWDIQVLGSAGVNTLGAYTSLALDKDGYPHISYLDADALKYVHWTGSSWDYAQTIDTRLSDDLIDGSFTSLALGGNGYPHIVYFKPSEHSLKYARWTGSAWAVSQVAWISGSYAYPSLALDEDDQPHISYNDGGLEYAHWTGSSWATQAVDSGGTNTSLALDQQGYPHISYGGKYASWTGSTWAIQTIDSGGAYNSLALGKNGYPHISYQADNNLRYARWTGSAWDVQSIDIMGNIERYASLALDADSAAHISYYDAYNDSLKYAHWANNTWSRQIVDHGGEYNTLALDGDGYPHIAYYGYYGDFGNRDIKYAYWTGSTWLTETVDVAGVLYAPPGFHISLALDEDNHPHIAYDDMYNTALKYARWTGSTWLIETIDNSGDVGSYPSLALDKNGYPHISYWDNTNYGIGIKYARWTASGWVSETVASITLDSAVGDYTSLALDEGSQPHIAYYDWFIGKLMYARWISNTWDIQTVDDGLAISWADSLSLALDNDGYPHISYHERSSFAWGALKYAQWTGSAWSIQTVDQRHSLETYYVGDNSSLALDQNGYPHIAYLDRVNGDLKYAWGFTPISRASLPFVSYGH